MYPRKQPPTSHTLKLGGNPSAVRHRHAIYGPSTVHPMNTPLPACHRRSMGVNQWKIHPWIAMHGPPSAHPMKTPQRPAIHVLQDQSELQSPYITRIIHILWWCLLVYVTLYILYHCLLIKHYVPYYSHSHLYYVNMSNVLYDLMIVFLFLLCIVVPRFSWLLLMYTTLMYLWFYPCWAGLFLPNKL